MSELEIEELEERLRAAMLAGDVESLSSLIAEDVIFTAPTGDLLSKAADLEMHRSRILRIDRLDLFDSRSERRGADFVVTTKARLEVDYDGVPISGVFAYTRVWRRQDGRWQIAIGHGSRVGDL